MGDGDGIWLAFGSWEKKYYSVRGAPFNVTRFPDGDQVLCLAYGNGLWIACDPFQTRQSSSCLVQTEGIHFFGHRLVWLA